MKKVFPNPALRAFILNPRVLAELLGDALTEMGTSTALYIQSSVVQSKFDNVHSSLSNIDSFISLAKIDEQTGWENSS